MTRLVCIGDCHFGPHGGGRNEDRYRSLDQIIDHGAALQGVGAWLFAGDVFHAKSTVEDRNEIAARLQRAADVAPIVMVYGNHDAPGDLEIFSRLSARHPIVVVTSPQVTRLQLATGETAAVFCLPYVHRAGLVTAGVMHADLGQTARALLEPIFMAAAADLDAAVDRGELPLFLAHINVGGSIASTGQPQIGIEIELDPALLGRLGLIPKILGHIHKHQQIHGAWYLGSIARMDFGEQEAKVFGVVEFDAPGQWSIGFHRLGVPPQYHVEGELTRDAFTIRLINDQGYCPMINPAPAMDWRGADVRVRYRFVHAEISALDVAKIHAEFAGCRSLKLDPVPELEHQVRAPEIAAAVTFEDKVKAYGEHRGLTITDGLLDKLARLQAHDGAAVLSQVAADLVDDGEPATGNSQLTTPNPGTSEPLHAAVAL